MPIIQSLDRALRILNLFDELHPEMQISEISSKLHLNKSTTHSLLKTLKHHGYIKQNGETGKYSLGLKLLERSAFLMNSMDIRTVAKKTLTDLSRQTNATIHLVMLEGDTGVYIDKVESPATTIIYSRIGRRVPLHSSAVGKALIAFLPAGEMEKILTDYSFIRQTDKTITSKEAFFEELEEVRKNGYAVDQEENEPGVYCIAAPLYDHRGQVHAAVSMSFPLSRMKVEDRGQLIRLLKDAAATISVQLGYEAYSKDFLY